MRGRVARIVWIGGLAALTLLVLRLGWKGAPAGTADPDSPPPGLGAADQKWDPAEIFRRAFWRHPAATDRIIRGARFEWKASDGSLERWQWFLELNPGPDLLGFLRDPENFGLIPAPTGNMTRGGAEAPGSAPAWFTPARSAAGFEVLQNPQGGLTLHYRAADNTLFATDTGHGFATPVQP
jgi:hypothetical protein